jgi:hypothetical protein
MDHQVVAGALPWVGMPVPWVLQNMLTGLSYMAIALVLRYWRGFVRPEYRALFALFIGACGAHHLVHSLMPLPWLDAGTVAIAQLVADTMMMVLSVSTAVLVLRDAWMTREVGRDL